MTTPVKVVADCSTGVVSEVPFSDKELQQLEIDMADAMARNEARIAEMQAAEEAKASAIAKLTALGLTEDEAKVIIR